MDISAIRKELLHVNLALAVRGYLFKEGSASPEELLYLSNLIRRHNVKLIADIGFNAGFSSLIFLASDPAVRVISFDIGDHGYVIPAKRYIDRRFSNRHSLIYGDTKETLPMFHAENPDLTFDLIFIDGGHDYETAKADLVTMKHFSRPETIVVMDDITPWLKWGRGPTRAWTEAIKEGLVHQTELIKDGVKVTEITPPGSRSWAVGHYNFF